MPALIYAAAQKNKLQFSETPKREKFFKGHGREHNFQNPTTLQDNTLVMDWLHFPGFHVLNHPNPYPSRQFTFLCL